MINAMLYNKRLQDAGFSKEQAEETINLLWDVMNDSFVTKQDLSEAKNELRNEILKFRHELKEDINNLRQEVKEDIHNLRQEVKEDIHNLHQEVKEDIQDLRTEFQDLKSDFKLLESKMTIKLGSMLIVSQGVLFTLLKLT